MNDTRPGQLLDTAGNPLKHTRVRFDMTINIPTLLSILSIAAAVAAFAVRVYSDFDKRLDRNSYDVAVMQERLRTIDTQVAQVRSDGNSNVQTLRGEIRVDLLEIKGDLKNLMFRQPGNSGRQLNEWSR